MARSLAPRLARKLLDGLTFSNVCSVLALTIALGTGTAYAANTVGSDDIIDESIQSVDIKNGEVSSNDLKNGNVKVADLGADAVPTAKILDGTIGTADLADGAVDSSKVANESLTSADLATDSVGATEIADDTIDSGEIVNDSLFASDLAANSVTSSELADNAVGSAEVANNSLTTADIAGTDSLGSISLGAGSVPDGRCKSFDITVGGALTGQGIIISTRAALPAGMMIYGQQVQADGHGIMTVCNLSGAALPALTDFPIRTLTCG